MENFHYLHFSNRTENLYQALKRSLFASSHPLTKRLVIVPSAAMKSWLMLQMAKDPEVGVCAGIEIGFLETSVKNLFERLGGKERIQEYYEPSELELALAIEESISAVAMEHQPQKEWLPLLHYLGIVHVEMKLSKKSLKRIRALSAILAKLFLEYGVSGGRMVAEWQQNPSGWQALLWQRMESVFSLWQYPAKKLGGFSIEQSISIPDMQIHVFGISFLTALHHQFLQTIAERIPVYYYLLSPCQKFWGDIVSEKESLRIRNYWDNKGAKQGNLEALEEFLRDRNPLLANFGRLGREMAVQMEAISAQSTEIYSLPQSIVGMPCYDELDSQEVYLEKKLHALTMLESIQADLTLLRTTENKTKIPFDTHDGTIQVHAAPKKSREVQVIYDTLLGIIDKHAKDENPISPSDIFVMAPNISEYVPFIRSIFESPESQLDVQVMDLEIPSQYLIIQGYLHLLSLSKGRWEASSIMQLFNYPAFRKRHRLNAEDVAIFEKWIKDAGIFWGKDDHHRREIFKRNYCDVATNEETTVGTWEHGLGRLLEGLAMMETSENGAGTHNPLSIIETSQAGLLGKVLFLLRSLQGDLKLLMNEKKLTLSDWSAYLRCLFDAYFMIGDENGEPDAYRILITHIESFAKASKKLMGTKFSFETIHRHLLEGLKKEKSIYKESNVQSVRFSSLLPMRAVPAKVIVLMGMDDGRFPGVDQTNPLNLLFQSPKADYYPTRVDFDRYVFLESILSARQYFILSYASQLPGEAKFQQPSLLIKELLNYIDEAYFINCEKPSKYCLKHHPLIPFHHTYFSETSHFKSYSQKNYEAALAFYHHEKQTRRAFISEFTPGAREQKEIKKSTVVLKDLLVFAKNPNKVYLNQVLGIYLSQEEDNVVQDQEDLFLSDLNASILTKQGLQDSPETLLKQARKTGKIPYGPFSEVATAKIQKDINRYLSHLQSCGVQVEELFAIEFMEHYQEPQLADKKWMFPSISLEVASFGNIKIVGRIENVSQKGMVFFYKEETKKVLENWPSCLILRYLIEKYSLSVLPQLIFIKGEKVKMKTIDISQTAEQALIDYLTYYLTCKDNPSPLTPDLVPTILTGDTEELTNVFKTEANDGFHPQYDPYTKWLERNSSAAEVVSTVEHWQPQAESLFIDIFADSKSKKIARRKV